MKLIESVILEKLSIKPRADGELLEHRALYIYTTQEIYNAINNLLSQGFIKLAADGKLEIMPINTK